MFKNASAKKKDEVRGSWKERFDGLVGRGSAVCVCVCGGFADAGGDGWWGVCCDISVLTLRTSSRYFVLRGYEMLYYKKQGDNKPKGTIDCRLAKIDVADAK